MILQAHDAYIHKNVHQSKQVHDGDDLLDDGHEEKHQVGGEYIKSAVYGGLDGMVTTFAVVTAAIGANLSAGVIMTLGVSTMIADGISMGLGDFISTKSETDFNLNERAREQWEVDNNPEGEKKEMIDIYKAKGIEHDDAVLIAETLAKNKKVWVDIMMVEELGIMGINDHPGTDAIVTFLSFICFGITPILPYIIGYAASKTENLFAISIAMTACFMFILGVMKSKFSYQSWLYSGVETLVAGSCAAGASYVIGLAFSDYENQG